MPIILHIETSTNVCSVAVSENGEIIFDKISYEGPSHAALLGVFVEEALNILKKEDKKPDAIAVSSGPGSYTGLRIGVSLAKGLCYGYGIPLLAIPTLEILAGKAIKLNKGDDGMIYCAMLDARRMEVYAAIYDARLNVLRPTMAEIVTEETYITFLQENKVCFFGNGANKCMDIITSPQAVFIENLDPLASDMVIPAEKAFLENKFEDVAYFEPFYLKEFVATIAKNKVLGNNQPQ